MLFAANSRCSWAAKCLAPVNNFDQLVDWKSILSDIQTISEQGLFAIRALAVLHVLQWHSAMPSFVTPSVPCQAVS